MIWHHKKCHDVMWWRKMSTIKHACLVLDLVSCTWRSCRTWGSQLSQWKGSRTVSWLPLPLTRFRSWNPRNSAPDNLLRNMCAMDSDVSLSAMSVSGCKHLGGSRESIYRLHMYIHVAARVSSIRSPIPTAAEEVRSCCDWFCSWCLANAWRDPV
jgi:hypothetical protein